TPAVTIGGGATLSIGNGGTAGQIGVSSISNNGNLVFNRSDAQSIGNLITGAGAVHKNGTGDLTLTATNTYSGATNVNAGTIIVTNASTAGSSLGSVPGAAVTLPVGTTLNIANIGSGTGTYNFGFKKFNVAGTGSGEGVIVN